MKPKKRDKNKYYDDKAYNDIFKLYLNGKYSVAKRYLFEYLEIYPDNINAKILLSRVLMALKEYSEAEKLLKYCIKKYQKHYVFVQNLVYLYLELEKYSEAYACYKKIDFDEYRKVNDKNTSELAALNVYLQIKLGKQPSDKEGYLGTQYKKYSKDLAVEHIKEKHVENGKNENMVQSTSHEEPTYFFEKNQDIKELLEQIETRIITAKKEPILDIVDIYYFKSENIGKYQDRYTDIIKVVTIKNTNQIITMFPIEKRTSINIINDLIEPEEYRTNKIRTRKTQIEKFNERYQ